MKVSVVVPAHNEEKYIATTLGALLKQDYPDYEIIVVNNASSDKTFEVASSFEGVKVVTETSKGLLYARERGRKEATGDIIANIDADCQPVPGWISAGVKIFKQDPTIVCASGPYDYHDGKPAFRAFSSFVQKTVYKATHSFLQFFRRGAVMIGGNNFISAEALRKIGGYDTSILFYGEDTDTAKRLSAVGRMIFDPKLTMATSARRYLADGTLKVSLLYVMNFIWFTFFRIPQKKISMKIKKMFSGAKR